MSFVLYPFPPTLMSDSVGAARVTESALCRLVDFVSIDSAFCGTLVDPGADGAPVTAGVADGADDGCESPDMLGLFGPRWRTAVENSQTKRRFWHRLHGLPPKH